MTITIATTDAEINACYPVMRELRPHIAENEFLAKIRSQETAGYRLAFLKQTEDVVAVAGFRISDNLALGRFLYIDDLVTLNSHRSQGFGTSLLSWLRALAVKENCACIHLDSGVQRKDAHRFYEREGMAVSSLHFSASMSDDLRTKTER